MIEGPGRTSIAVDVVSDVVCPWCYLGQRRLDRAIDGLPDLEVEVRWRPFQLDPTIPPEGMDRRAYMIAKFGSEQRIREAHSRIKSLGTVEGIAFDFAAIRIAPNTLNAHRLIRWAATAGNAVQYELVRILFSRYFERGENIGDDGRLLDAAVEAGMDATPVETLLSTDQDVAAVRAEIAAASRMGITGVPCFLLEGRYAVMGAQEADTLAGAFRQVAAAKRNGQLHHLG